MDTACFWSQFKPGELEFCEEKLCAWIVSPAETWSNLAYILVAILIFTRFSHVAGSRRFGFYALIVGIASFSYHATHIWILETIDLGAMLFLGVDLVCTNLIRLEWLKAGRKALIYTVLLVGSASFLFILAGEDRLLVFTGVIAVATWFEVLLSVRAKRLGQRIRYRAYLASLGLLAVSYTFWVLDHSRIWCNPKEHFRSGHAIWHVVNSGCFLTLLCHYSQFSVTAPRLRVGSNLG